MSLLEATALNLPIIARDISLLRSIGITYLFQKPIVNFLKPERTHLSSCTTKQLSINFTKKAQETALFTNQAIDINGLVSKLYIKD
jgi:hypothetical protein